MTTHKPFFNCCLYRHTWNLVTSFTDTALLCIKILTKIVLFLFCGFQVVSAVLLVKECQCTEIRLRKAVSISSLTSYSHLASLLTEVSCKYVVLCCINFFSYPLIRVMLFRTDSPDCSLKLLSISVVLLFSFSFTSFLAFTFSALMLLVGWQVGHPACKN